MNVLFLTQSLSLDMFYNLMQIMKEAMDLDKVGFHVSDSRFFKHFKKDHPEIESFHILKEWEIIRDSRGRGHEVSSLARYEKELGRPLLWNALVADRWIYFGKKCMYDQDYRPRYSHERMLAILQVGLERIEEFFNQLQPDLVVSFQCTTLGEYVSYLVALTRGVTFLNLRPTRIENFVYAGESILEPSERLAETYDRFLKDGIEGSLKDKAVSYVRQVRSTHSMYEGVVPTSGKPPASHSPRKERLPVLGGLKRTLIGEYKHRFGEYQDDNQVSSYIGSQMAQRIIRPWRAFLIGRRFHDLYVRASQLPDLDYAFFPLHTEPEITLSVYSKPYLNQIEAIRLFSHSLPVHMKLVVKEHPWSIGKRPLSYYRKLLEIPNVLLADPAMKSRELVANSRLVTVIAGSIGLEALVLKKPVIALGRVPFSFLPSTAIRHVANPDSLGDNIRDLLECHQHDETALLCYVAAVMNDSAPVDFYSRLLGRKGVYRPDDGQNSKTREKEQRTAHLRILARYIERRFGDLSRIRGQGDTSRDRAFAEQLKEQ